MKVIMEFQFVDLGLHDELLYEPDKEDVTEDPTVEHCGSDVA